MFTRRHYETIARDLKTARGFGIMKHSPEARITHALICNEFATNFKAGNELFDRNRFLAACGLDAETIDNL